MKLTRLPFDSDLAQYQNQAAQVLENYVSGDPEAIQFLRNCHPRFRNPDVPWLPRQVSDEEVQSAALDRDDAQMALAHWYDFRDWPALAKYVGAVTESGSGVHQFETAVEAVISGDVAALEESLRANPELVHARSTRVTPFDPPVHRATLLHYLGANGVEGYRQKSPANAVAVGKLLLDAGAEVDSLADLYGGRCTTMNLLVSSTPPAEAGVQVPLVELLLDRGAAIEGSGSGNWVSPLMTALAFGFLDVAKLLVGRGAKVENVAVAAGLGRVDDVALMLPASSVDDRHRAMALAAQHGHAAVVSLLLDADENPDRYNPEGLHAHSTPLHQAALGGHLEVVRLLVERGARLDFKDQIYHGTPLGWAEHGGRREVADYLRAQSAG